MKENTPHDLLQTLMALYSDAIEYYGANDDHEMCIDLNMRMQSVLVRPYILDCLCEHNQLTTSQTENFKDQLYGAAQAEQNESLPEDDSVEVEFDVKTNFESDKRRKSNPFKKIFKKKKDKEESSGSSRLEVKSQNSGSQIDSSTTAKSNGDAPTVHAAPTQVKVPTKPVGIISQSSSPGVREK